MGDRLWMWEGGGYQMFTNCHDTKWAHYSYQLEGLHNLYDLHRGQYEGGCAREIWNHSNA